MKKDEKKKFVGGGLYIVIAACVLSAMTINLVSRLNKSNTEIADMSSVDANVEGVTDDSQSAPDLKEENPPVPITPKKEVAHSETVSQKKEELPTFICPVADGVFGEFAPDVMVYSQTLGDYRVHNGIDIYAPLGTEVCAFASGTISEISDDTMFGKTVTIDHGGELISVYSNLSDELAEGIEVGKEIKSGQTIGKIGNTALCECLNEPHLHFEVSFEGNDVNPSEYMEKSA